MHSLLLLSLSFLLQLSVAVPVTENRQVSYLGSPGAATYDYVRHAMPFFDVTWI